jgi:hypothetical protein
MVPDFLKGMLDGVHERLGVGQEPTAAIAGVLALKSAEQDLAVAYVGLVMGGYVVDGPTLERWCEELGSPDFSREVHVSVVMLPFLAAVLEKLAIVEGIIKRPA